MQTEQAYMRTARKFENYEQLEAAFIAGKIAVSDYGGRVGLFSNTPDILYWRPILQHIWRYNNWLHKED